MHAIWCTSLSGIRSERLNVRSLYITHEHKPKHTWANDKLWFVRKSELQKVLDHPDDSIFLRFNIDKSNRGNPNIFAVNNIRFWALNSGPGFLPTDRLIGRLVRWGLSLISKVHDIFQLACQESVAAILLANVIYGDLSNLPYMAVS